jgi:nucleoid-associated protein YgaU
MHLVPSSPAPVHHPGLPGTVVPPPSRRPAVTGRDHVWTIRPGDHLWKVAQVTLAQTWGHGAGDAAILAYVHEIERANGAVFVVPGHPELVYPGQRFMLPPVAIT